MVDNRKIFTVSHPTLGFAMEATDGTKAFTKHLYRARFFRNVEDCQDYIRGFSNAETRKLLNVRPLSLDF